MIDESASLEDVVFAICTELNARGLKVVLVGGSAATYYAPAAYQSFDADFIAQFAASKDTGERVVAAMSDLGYYLDAQKTFRHRHGSPFAVEFPKGPLAIGGHDVGYRTITRDREILYVISATDSVRDRLCSYYFWNDRTALRAAVDVSIAAADVDLKSIQAWSDDEGHSAMYAEFLRLFESQKNQRAMRALD
jgi:hypothetical protein